MSKSRRKSAPGSPLKIALGDGCPIRNGIIPIALGCLLPTLALLGEGFFALA
jgi:hypothetical protein